MAFNKSTVYFMILSITVLFFGLLAYKMYTQPYYPPSNIPKEPLGNPDSSIIVKEYSDFECPACKKYHPEYKMLINDYKDKVRFEFVQFPLTSIHQDALLAAEASECASDQYKFWIYVDELFKTDDLKKKNLISMAKKLHLNMESFEACLASRAKSDHVLAQLRQGKRLGIRGTPSISLNGKLLETNDLENLRKQLDALLDIE